ncbi:MAG: hypothetical protein MJK13_11465 [Pseudomonadales bacterium]|nr:hypothetical protein [Pseudomonadales bacterium]
MGAVLFSLPRYALSEINVRLMGKEKIARSDFAKRVGIDQTNLRWPLNRCPALFSAETKGISREHMELVIICNAFKRANLTDNIQFVPSGNAQRQKIELAKGNADLLAHSIFKQSLSEAIQPTASSFLLTDPVIKQGQFFVGIYTSANQLEDVSKALSDNKLNTLIGTTLTSWKIAAKTLQEMPIESLRLLSKEDLIVPNLQRKRANFTLYSLDKKRVLKRVNGYIVALSDERVFIVNKHKPELYEALQNYIVYLREQGDLLTEAYVHSDFISDKYKDWTLIN